MKKSLLLLALTGFTSTVLADKLQLPVDAPPAYRAECAGCHLAFPPQLLAARDWRRIMAALDRHFGDNASLEAPTQRSIEDFLTRHAGKEAKVSPVGTASPQALPRITAGAWFQRKHHEVSRADWAGAKSAANCAACHRQAANGSYREREIVMPDGRRWQD